MPCRTGTGPSPARCAQSPQVPRSYHGIRAAPVIASFRQAISDDRLFTGPGRLTERKVLRYLLLRAEHSGSLLVIESQRQIAEAIDVHQPTVSKALVRLESLRWLSRRRGQDPWATTQYVLRVPDILTELSARSPKKHSAGFLADNSVHAYVHRLFGPAGLGPGPAEALAALPEWRVALSRGHMVRIAPGSGSAPSLTNPWAGRRQVPRPSRGWGRSVAELVAETGKSRPTISRHLKRLRQRGLVFDQIDRDGTHRWWRYRFDAEAVAERDKIPDTAEMKRVKHRAERSNFWRHLAGSVDRSNSPVVTTETVNGRLSYVDKRTGLVLQQEPLLKPAVSCGTSAQGSRTMS